MRRYLSDQMAVMHRHLDEKGTATVPLLAAFGLALTWQSELHALPHGWDRFTTRVSAALDFMKKSPDAGQVSQFGLWDGLSAIWREIIRIEKL